MEVAGKERWWLCLVVVWLGSKEDDAQCDGAST